LNVAFEKSWALDRSAFCDNVDRCSFQNHFLVRSKGYEATAMDTAPCTCLSISGLQLCSRCDTKQLQTEKQPVFDDEIAEDCAAFSADVPRIINRRKRNHKSLD
jgi:hypothetical protein